MRINTEIRDETEFYIELNTPVKAYGKQGWLNIDNWDSKRHSITCEKDGNKTTFKTDFLSITFIGVGITGGCPAEKSNDGCFYGTGLDSLVLPEMIQSNKEFCNLEFAFSFSEEDAHGESYGGKSLPAIPEEIRTVYPGIELSAENAAKIRCEQVLGQYKVIFER